MARHPHLRTEHNDSEAPRSAALHGLSQESGIPYREIVELAGSDRLASAVYRAQANRAKRAAAAERTANIQRIVSLKGKRWTH